ncbi:carboxylesterase family protein [Frigoribacterium sp. CFBP 8754]|uniref:carboxylesterase family protein n=1 Tax=unclassified Frigoribacterium TaxID=2627005 RepID=UPI0016232950|nr:carboxylesterase family protein [Frigoribacterium sp. NBH87]MBD8661247.1 carboxylesterase family protein [Frigoribacterium sp. CFBP 8754]QNE43766.1 carboxylesterase family protein [Frigoribacterium sp. NBH87]
MTAPTQPRAPRETRSFAPPSGPVVGLVDGDVVRVLGVPYAEAERFEAPRPATPAVDADGRAVPYEAFSRAPASPQLSSRTLSALIEGASDGMVDSERCQALSITLPADLEPGESLPVMVWIHGGSYVTGAGDLGVYDPRALVAEQRVVVVTVTYRLGMLGFYGDGASVPANLGLLDQVAAVRWVHENVAAFGGDPDRVTLFGQSAGGDSVAHLMISEGARGLFRRAIVQSAPLGITRGRSRMNRAMVEAVGTPPRNAPVAQVLALQAAAEKAARRFGLRGGMAFGLQYGQAPLPAEADREAAWREVAPDVDLLIGSTSEETGLFFAFVPALERLAALPVVGRVFRRLLVGATTHAIYGRDARAFAARHRAAGGRAVRYELTWAPEGAVFGAAHVTDVPLLLGGVDSWGHTMLVGDADWADVDRRGRRVRQIWADFARTGTVAADAGAGLQGTIRLFRS